MHPSFDLAETKLQIFDKYCYSQMVILWHNSSNKGISLNLKIIHCKIEIKSITIAKA